MGLEGLGMSCEEMSGVYWDKMWWVVFDVWKGVGTEKRGEK